VPPDTGEGTLGFTDSKGKRIVVDSRLGPAQKASTIAHELGHVHCGHVDGDYAEYHRHRGRTESEAEAVAYLGTRAKVATTMQADSFSPSYIATWSKGRRRGPARGNRQGGQREQQDPRRLWPAR
jgi:hypothetical protein